MRFVSFVLLEHLLPEMKIKLLPVVRTLPTISVQYSVLTGRYELIPRNLPVLIEYILKYAVIYS